LCDPKVGWVEEELTLIHLCFFLLYSLIIWVPIFNIPPPPPSPTPQFKKKEEKRNPENKPGRKTKTQRMKQRTKRNKQAKLRLCGVLFSGGLKSQGCVAKCSSMRGFFFVEEDSI
jgi:hypothetical protein